MLFGSWDFIYLFVVVSCTIHVFCLYIILFYTTLKCMQYIHYGMIIYLYIYHCTVYIYIYIHIRMHVCGGICMLHVCVHISNIHMIYHNIISQTNTTCNTKSYKDDVQNSTHLCSSVRIWKKKKWFNVSRNKRAKTIKRSNKE